MNTIFYELTNFKKKSKNNTTNFKIPTYIPITSNDFSIKIFSKNQSSVQFKLNHKFIDSISFTINNEIYEYDNLLKLNNDILINTELFPETPLIIKPTIIDYCSNITIFEITSFENITYTNIFWDKIFIINLFRRTDRKEKMIQKLSDANINNYEFINAIDGKDPVIYEEFKTLKNNNRTFIPNTGHYGCLLSHINILLQAKKENLESIMILEDDILFCDDFLNKIQNMLIPQYDILYLGGLISEYKLFTNNWGTSNQIMSTFSLIINKNMYDNILDKIKNRINCIDIYYIKEFQSNYNYKVFLLNDLIYSDFENSDTSKKNKIFKNMVKIIKKNI